MKKSEKSEKITRFPSLVHFHPVPVLIHGDELPDVLDDECALLDDLGGHQAPAPTLGTDNLEVRILPLLEPHIITAVFGVANLAKERDVGIMYNVYVCIMLHII